ncbi:MAG: ABC transporter permease [Bacteroidota bacterium]
MKSLKLQKSFPFDSKLKFPLLYTTLSESFRFLYTSLIKIVIEAGQFSFRQRFKELFAYRELLFTLAYRDIRVRYAQTAVGLAWAVVNPVLQILLLSFVFGTIAKVGTGDSDIPHIIYTTAGMCGWVYFANVLTGASTSIIGAQAMIKKIYFPRLILPLSKALTGFIDLAVMLVIIFLLILIYGLPLSPNLIYLPIFLSIAVLSGLAFGIWLSALSIRYRDFTQITPLLLRLGMYATPIAYPASAVPEKYQLVFYLNPMTGVIEGVRWCFVGGTAPSEYIYLSFFLIVGLFISGMFYFFKIERSIADIV